MLTGVILAAAGDNIRRGACNPVLRTEKIQQHKQRTVIYQLASVFRNGLWGVLFICIESCWEPEHRDCGRSRPGAQTSLLSMQNVLLEQEGGFNLILLSLLWVSPRYDDQGLSL